MTQGRFDLEKRSYVFAREVMRFCKDLPRTISNIECHKQAIRSAGSIGANYIEANEALGKKDFLMHIRICRKEAKENVYWLQLLISTNDEKFQTMGTRLINESIELKKIFSAIIINTEQHQR